MESITILRPPGSNLSSCAYCISAAGRCAQSISKTRPSRFVILSASFGSLAGQRSKARAQDDPREAASFDSQNVFFEMSCPLRASWGREATVQKSYAHLHAPDCLYQLSLLCYNDLDFEWASGPNVVQRS